MINLLFLFLFSFHISDTLTNLKVEDLKDLIQPRIHNGIVAKNQFPFQALLLINKTIYREVCGGALVGSRWVLTAAHCLQMAGHVRLVLGAQEIRSDDKNRIKMELNQNDFIIHPNFPREWHNIALIRLPERIRFTPYIKRVQLPCASDVWRNFTSREVVTSGWGRRGGKQLPKLMHWITMNIVDPSQCEEYHSRFMPISDGVICAQGLGGGPCDGDIGGPLTQSMGNRFKRLIGITSFVNDAGCDVNFLAGFVKVSTYMAWITENTNNEVKFSNC